MKFALLCAILLTLLAVSSATWTIEQPTPNAVLSPGKLIDLKFKTDATVAATDSFVISADWMLNLLVVGPGGFLHCNSTADKIVAHVVRVPDSADWTVTFDAPLAAESVITCPIRVLYNQKSDSTISVSPAPAGAAPTPVAIALEKIPAVQIISASRLGQGIDWSTAVSLEFSNLPTNSIIGPISVGYRFGADDDRELDYRWGPMNPLFASDAKIAIAQDVHLRSLGLMLWIVTGPTPAATALWDATWETFSIFEREELDGKEYGPYLSIATIQDKVEKPVRVDAKVGTLVFEGHPDWAFFTRQNNVVHYQHIHRVASADKVNYSFSISNYGASTIFGKNAKLTLFLDDDRVGTPLDISPNQSSFILDVTKGKQIKVEGSFPVSGAWTELSTYTGTLDGVTTSDTMVVLVAIDDSSLALESYNEATGDVAITFNLEVHHQVSRDYLGPVLYHDIYLDDRAYRARQEVGDARASGHYYPSCTSDDPSFVFTVEKASDVDGLDLDYHRYIFSGRLANGAAIQKVKCSQRLRPGPRYNTQFRWLGVTADIFTKATTKYNQWLLVNSASEIQSATQLHELIATVVTTLKSSFPDPADGFQGLLATDFHYQRTPQSYAARNGFLVDPSGPFAAPYSTGAELSLAFTPTNAPTFVPKTVNIYGETLKLTLIGVASEGLTAQLAFLDGTNDAVYNENQAVGHGPGIACATTAQCAGNGGCVNNVCVQALTQAQRNALAAGGGFSSASVIGSSAAVLIALATVLLLVF